MCTLLVGRDVVAPGTVLLAANRDEDPRRPSDPPGVLSDRPRVVGGRDRVAGGTWLAVRAREAAVAMLNRHDPAWTPLPNLRSRGLLTLDAACADQASEPQAGLPPVLANARSAINHAILSRAWSSVREHAYAPFSMVCVSPEFCAWLSLAADREARIRPIDPGWPALTHPDLDDRRHPATPR